MTEPAAAAGALFAILAAISFAFWNIFLQRGLQKGGSPRSLLFILCATLIAFMGPVVGWQYWRGLLPPWRPEALVWFMVAGVLTVTVGSFFASKATLRIGAAGVAAVRLLDPLFAFIIAFIFLGERLSGQALGGVMLIVAALGLLQLDQGGGAASGVKSGRALGLVAAVAASLTFTVGAIARKSGLVLMSAPTIAALGEGLGGLLAFLIMVAGGSRGGVRESLRREAVDFWWAGVAMVFGTLFVNMALQRVAVPVGVALRNTSPWFVLLFVPLLFGRQQRPGRWVWASTALLTVGMLLIVLR